MMLAVFHIQPALNRLFINCIKLPLIFDQYFFNLKRVKKKRILKKPRVRVKVKVKFTASNYAQTSPLHEHFATNIDFRWNLQ